MKIDYNIDLRQHFAGHFSMVPDTSFSTSVPYIMSDNTFCVISIFHDMKKHLSFTTLMPRSINESGIWVTIGRT